LVILYVFQLKLLFQCHDDSRKLSHKLDELKKMIQDAVVSRVVEDFVDINTPLKQFTDAVHVPKGKVI